MNLAFARRQATFTATTQVIVMRTQDDCLVLQFRIAAGQDADDVE
jgi:hypothetical protein